MSDTPFKRCSVPWNDDGVGKYPTTQGGDMRSNVRSNTTRPARFATGIAILFGSCADGTYLRRLTRNARF